MTAVSKDMWMREAAKDFRHFGTLPMPDIRPNDPLDYRTLWIGIDTDGDGLINLAEYNELLSRGFDKFDQNPQDGRNTRPSATVQWTSSPISCIPAGSCYLLQVSL